MKTLYVEDDEGWSQLCPQLLAQGGFIAEPFVHVPMMETALLSIARDVPELILLDLALPDSGRLQTIARIPDLDKIAPVVVLSGTMPSISRADCMSAGAMAFLAKDRYAKTPFQLADACFTAVVNWRRIPHAT